MPKADYEYINEEDRVMTIETKYNIGDEVWFMADNKVRKAIIYGFACVESCLYIKDGESCGIHTDLDYIVCISQGHTTKMYDCDLFPTKEELLKSL